MESSNVEFAVSSSDKLPTIDAAFGSGKGYDPVCELMRAIILRTVDDLHSGGEFKAEALEYLYDEEDEYVFSFQAICKHIGFDPAKTREMIINPGRKISTRRRAA